MAVDCVFCSSIQFITSTTRVNAKSSLQILEDITNWDLGLTAQS
uniref:Uncharacterized protein n=1 Tax=Arundo donax TaxID=35708 RepID=A0A0A8ZEU5_ARUDO